MKCNKLTETTSSLSEHEQLGDYFGDMDAAVNGGFVPHTPRPSVRALAVRLVQMADNIETKLPETNG